MMVVTPGKRRSAKAPFSISKPSSSITPGFLRASSTLLARAISALDDESHVRPLRIVIDISQHSVANETKDVLWLSVLTQSDIFPTASASSGIVHVADPPVVEK